MEREEEREKGERVGTEGDLRREGEKEEGGRHKMAMDMYSTFYTHNVELGHRTACANK